MFDVLINGVGDAFSTKHYGTNFLCRTDDFLLAVDCPDSYRRALKDSQFKIDDEPLDLSHIDAMFLTHLHGDHVNGLEMSLAYLKFVCQKRLVLYTTPEVAEDLWERRLAVSLGTMFDGEKYVSFTQDDYIDLRVVDWGELTKIGPFDVETRATIHHIPTAGLRIEHEGLVLGYACDTAYDPGHIEWLSSANVIIHESNYGPAHTPIAKLEALPAALRQKLWIVHYADHQPIDVDGLNFAREGQILTVK